MFEHRILAKAVLDKVSFSLLDYWNEMMSISYKMDNLKNVDIFHIVLIYEGPDKYKKYRIKIIAKSLLLHLKLDAPWNKNDSIQRC